jgi:hypothetical protein
MTEMGSDKWLNFMVNFDFDLIAQRLTKKVCPLRWHDGDEALRLIRGPSYLYQLQLGIVSDDLGEGPDELRTPAEDEALTHEMRSCC